MVRLYTAGEYKINGWESPGFWSRWCWTYLVQQHMPSSFPSAGSINRSIFLGLLINSSTWWWYLQHSCTAKPFYKHSTLPMHTTTHATDEHTYIHTAFFGYRQNQPRHGHIHLSSPFIAFQGLFAGPDFHPPSLTHFMKSRDFDGPWQSNGTSGYGNKHHSVHRRRAWRLLKRRNKKALASFNLRFQFEEESETRVQKRLTYFHIDTQACGEWQVLYII